MCDDDDDRGYNDYPEHDMWVDYTTDMYEDTDYSGQNPDYDDDDDDDDDDDYYRDYDPDYDPDYDRYGGSSHYDALHHQNGSPAQRYEPRKRHLKWLLAAAIAAAFMSRRKGSAKEAAQQEKIVRYQTSLYEPEAEYEARRTRRIAIVCAIICIIAILIAITV